jgi:hypothetical protein
MQFREAAAGHKQVRAPMADGAQHQRAENLMGFLDLLTVGDQAAPPGLRNPPSLADRERHRFERSEMRKQRIDLIGSGEAPPHALFGSERRHILPAKQDPPTVGTQHAGHQIDKRGLAGAVWTDQRMTRAGRQREIDVGGDDE